MGKRKIDVNLVEDGLESVESAAAFLKISRGGMREIIRRGEIKVARIGRRLRIPTKALHEFAAGKIARKVRDDLLRETDSKTCFAGGSTDEK